MVLPTDDPGFLSFLAQVEGQSRAIQTLRRPTDRSLLVVASKQGQGDAIAVAIQDYDAMMEERFQYNWPEGTQIEDNRDSIHQYGWCYVRMTGSLHGQAVEGTGQIPFVYSVGMSRRPWMKVSIGQTLLIDTPSGAAYLNQQTGEKVACQPGSFIELLNHPWSGLHCIDTVRRAAVKKRITRLQTLAFFLNSL